MSDFVTKQLRGTAQNALTTELNSLANNSLALGNALTLTSSGYLFAEVEAVFQFGSAPTANTGLAVWFLREIDGTNYEDGGASVTPARPPDLVIPVRAVATAQRVIRRVAVPPGAFKPLLKNDGTGQALAAASNTVKIRPFTLEQEEQ